MKKYQKSTNFILTDGLLKSFHSFAKESNTEHHSSSYSSKKFSYNKNPKNCSQKRMSFDEFMELPNENTTNSSKMAAEDFDFDYLNGLISQSEESTANKTSENFSDNDYEKEMSINKNLKKDKKKYYVVCDNDEACKSNMTYSFYRAVKTTPCEGDSLTNFPYS